MPEISQATRKLSDKYQSWYQSTQKKDNIALIHIDEVVGQVASFYEKMRGVIDWREEHLLRKTAIERILRRRLFLKKSGDNVAEPLVYELIRGGHFPNDAIPETKIAEIQKLIDKYVFILENAPKPENKQKFQLYDWLAGLAACEIEETLAPPIRENALIEYMFEFIKERVEVKEGLLVHKGIPEEEKNTQIYISVQQALFKLDRSIISYHLLKRWYPQWENLPQEQLGEITKNIYSTWGRIEENLKHPLAEKFYNICERQDTPFLVLGDILSSGPSRARETLENTEKLESEIRTTYKIRLGRLKARMRRAAIYSTISILITKMLLAFAVEVPFDRYITSQFSYFTLGLNILLPSMLMLILVLSIRPPSKRNEDIVAMEVIKIVYEGERKDVYEVRPPKKRGFILGSAIAILYLASFVASFGFIYWGLKRLSFSLLSILIFLVFVSLISFAGMKIRQRAKELSMEKERESFLRIFFDIFSLPFIRMGKILSAQWAKYNVLVVLINSLLDMPFQVFVEFLEQWRSFLKEKKEEIH